MLDPPPPPHWQTFSISKYENRFKFFSQVLEQNQCSYLYTIWSRHTSAPPWTHYRREEETISGVWVGYVTGWWVSRRSSSWWQTCAEWIDSRSASGSSARRNQNCARKCWWCRAVRVWGSTQNAWWIEFLSLLFSK